MALGASLKLCLGPLSSYWALCPALILGFVPSLFIICYAMFGFHKKLALFLMERQRRRSESGGKRRRRRDLEEWGQGNCDGGNIYKE